MMGASGRLRGIVWTVALGVAFALYLGLTFQVRTVKSDVARAERRIVALDRQTQRLQTEFETRSNLRQLSEWNAVDFGYQAPRADQYLANERQLASLGASPAPGAPSPIRVARAVEPDDLPAGLGLAGGRSDGRSDMAARDDTPDDGTQGRHMLVARSGGSLGARLSRGVVQAAPDEGER